MAEINLKELAAAISKTILGFAPQSQKTLEDNKSVTENFLSERVKKKRGRPKKEDKRDFAKEAIDMANAEAEEMGEFLNEVNQHNKTVEVEIVHKPKQTGVAPAKKVERTPDGDKTVAVKRPWEPPKKIKFVDTGEHADQKMDTSKWPEKDRRAPAVKVEYVCKNCGIEFDAYPSEVAGGEFTRCENCVMGLVRPNRLPE